MANRSAKSVARGATDSPPLRALARIGFAVNGLLHILIGWIAIQVAFGGGSAQPSQSGALSHVASAPGGRLLLWVIVVGYGALAFWLIAGAFLFPGKDAKNRASSFIMDFGKGIVYLVLAGTALTFARGSSTNSASSTGSTSASILSHPGGVILISVVGIVIVGIGLYFIYKGLRRGFKEDISVPSGRAGEITVFLGIVGYVAKGVALGVVGILFVIAALTLNPAKANGLDAAIRTLAALPYGPPILILVGLGLIAYGMYCFVRARMARL